MKNNDMASLFLMLIYLQMNEEVHAYVLIKNTHHSMMQMRPKNQIHSDKALQTPALVCPNYAICNTNKILLVVVIQAFITIIKK